MDHGKLVIQPNEIKKICKLSTIMLMFVFIYLGKYGISAFSFQGVMSRINFFRKYCPEIIVLRFLLLYSPGGFS